MTESKLRQWPASLLAPKEDLNLKGLTDEERADYLAQLEVTQRAVVMGMEKVRLRQEDLIARGLMDEKGNLIDPPNLDDPPEAWEAKRSAVTSHRSEN